MTTIHSPLPFPTLGRWVTLVNAAFCIRWLPAPPSLLWVGGWHLWMLHFALYVWLLAPIPSLLWVGVWHLWMQHFALDDYYTFPPSLGKRGGLLCTKWPKASHNHQSLCLQFKAFLGIVSKLQSNALNILLTCSRGPKTGYKFLKHLVRDVSGPFQLQFKSFVMQSCKYTYKYFFIFFILL